MPSPLAHASLTLLALPLLHAERPPLRSALARPALALLCALTLCLPDLDIALGALAGDAFTRHGTVTHALVWTPLAALFFTLAARPFTRARTAHLVLLGAALFASHVLMDAATRGRGVSLLWPLFPQRLHAPFTLFVGVRYSEPLNWHAHAQTLANESAFALVVYATALLVWHHRRPRPGLTP